MVEVTNRAHVDVRLPERPAAGVALPDRLGIGVALSAGAVPIPGPQGPTGPEGPQGPPGRGLEGIQGTLASPYDLPDNPELGDAWIIDGQLWIWKG